jgi:hypothetical protein
LLTVGAGGGPDRAGRGPHEAGGFTESAGRLFFADSKGLIHLTSLLADDDHSRKGRIMANGYMPRQDVAAKGWMRTFADGLLARPEVYGVTLADAESVDAVVEIYELALARATSPSTRTRGAVCVKTETRVAAEQVISDVYLRIKANRSVSDEDRIAIGMKPTRKRRSRVACPATRPSIQVDVHPAWQHILRFQDGNSIGTAKPAGAVALQVFVVLADAPVSDLSQARLLKSVTRTPARIQYKMSEDGKVATYTARWISRRGETGPWSTAITRRVAA